MGKWIVRAPNKADREFDNGADAMAWLAKNRRELRQAKLFNPEGKVYLTVGQPETDA